MNVGRPGARGPRLYLVDDPVARSFDPLTTGRPFGELLHGCTTFRSRWERALGTQCSGHLAGPTLLGFDEPSSAVAVGEGDVEASGSRWFVASRFLVAHGALEEPSVRQHLAAPDDDVTLTHNGRIVAVRVAGKRPHGGVAERIAAPAAGAGGEIEVGGHWIDHMWSLMSDNAAQTREDFAHDFAGTPSSLPPGVDVLGSGGVSVGERVLFEPGVVLDSRSGPIRIDDEVTIRAFTRLAGPSYVGPGCVVFGGNLSAVSLGPVCKVRGEIEETVIGGYSNKAHDGFLGHAYLGRWVNLGALTTNSDLKNNYGDVRLRLPTGDVDTGVSKIGCFLGDHVKTGIGTMLNTGTLIGLGSNVFGGVMPPTFVPPFSWGSASELVPYRFDKFTEVAERVMARRDIDLTAGTRTALSRVWERVHGQRAQ